MRKATVTRDTKETKIKCDLNIDGTGISNINTSVGFFDHMLDQISRHGLMDLNISCEGDTHIDCHHTIEDVGIVLGNCIHQALGDLIGIKRYGHVYLPMEEALVLCAIDICNRPYLSFDGNFTSEMVGDMQTEMVEEFFRSLTINGKFTLHIKVLSGKNNHHIIECIFKAFAKAFDMATSYDDRIKGVMSTKGVI